MNIKDKEKAVDSIIKDLVENKLTPEQAVSRILLDEDISAGKNVYVGTGYNLPYEGISGKVRKINKDSNQAEVEFPSGETAIIPLSALFLTGN